jgi:SAM-dependent methyltransferase
MVAILRARGLEAVEAGFLTYVHEGEAPQLVHSRNALHHLPDFWKGVALVRIHDLLVPGGTFVLRDLVYDFEPREAPQRIEAWLAAAAPGADEGWTRDELAEHVRSEHSTYAFLLEPLLERAGFEIREASDGAYVCGKR